MKIALCVAVMMLPVVAAAEDFEKAVRLGPARMTQPYECDASPEEGEGLGLAVDGEVGKQVGPHASVAGFAGYSMIPYEGTCSDMGVYTWDFHEHSFSAGARVQVTTRGMFVGFGGGREKTHETGRSTSDPRGDVFPKTTRDVDRWLDGRWLVEAHGGFTFPKLDSCGGCALQLFGMVTSAGDTTTMRLALGVQF